MQGLSNVLHAHTHGACTVAVDLHVDLRLVEFQVQVGNAESLVSRGLLHELRDDLAQAVEVRRLDDILHRQRNEATSSDGRFLDHDALRQIEALNFRHHVLGQFILGLGTLFRLHERNSNETIVRGRCSSEPRRGHTDQSLTLGHGVHHVDDVREVGVHQFEAGAFRRGALHHEAALVFGGCELALQIEEGEHGQA